MLRVSAWIRSVILGTILFIPWAACAEGGVAPAHGIHEWVAGAGIGTEDGAFDQARFKDLAGLVYDPIADRLLVADRGAGRIRTIALSKLNQVGTLGQGDGLDLSSLGLVSPTALAWLEPGVSLLVLDPGRRALSVIDLKAGKVIGLLSPDPGTNPVLEALLGHGTDVVAIAGNILVGSGNTPELGLVNLTPQGLVLRRTWTVAGLPNGPGLSALTMVNGQILCIQHNEQACSFCDVRDEANGYPGQRFGGADTQLPITLTAQALNLGQLRQPWAFVKGGDPLELVTRSPYLAAKIERLLPECVVWKLGVYDRDDRIIGVDDDQIFGRAGNVSTDPEAKGHAWLRNVAGAASDPRTNTWYLSDPSNGRILSFRPIEGTERWYRTGNLPGFAEWNFPVVRRPEVRRLAVMNLSRMMWPSDTSRHSHSFSKRLEHYLNMMSALQGQAQGYEVLFIGAPWGYEPAVLSSLGQLREKWERVKSVIDPDELILVMGPMDIYQATLDFQRRPYLQDGLPDLKFDPEFVLSPDPRKLLPEYLDISRYMKNNPSLKFGGLERDAYIFNTDSYLFQHSYNLLRRYLVDLQEKVRAGMLHGRRLDVTILYYPDCNGISEEEGGQPVPLAESVTLGRVLRKECKALGWRFMDITSEIRIFAADDPFMIDHTLHPTARGHDNLAFITAWRLMHSQDKTAAESKADSSHGSGH